MRWIIEMTPGRWVTLQDVYRGARHGAPEPAEPADPGEPRGFGTETYAGEELRAEIAAMMVGERLGVGHEPRHGTAYVSSWIKALENDPKELRAAAVDAQRISDWLISRERDRSLGDEKAEPARPEGAAGRTPERDPEPSAAARAGGARRTAGGAGGRDEGPGPRGGGGKPYGRGAGGRDAPAMSEELKTVLRDVGAAGYRLGVSRGAGPAGDRSFRERERLPSARRREGTPAGAAAGARGRVHARHARPSARLRPGGRRRKHGGCRSTFVAVMLLASVRYRSPRLVVEIAADAPVRGLCAVSVGPFPRAFRSGCRGGCRPSPSSDADVAHRPPGAGSL